MELSRTHGSQPAGALMKRSSKYVARDVHQATTVTSVREEGGRVIARTVLPTEAAAIVEYLRGTINVTFEEGTQAHWLHELIVPIVQSFASRGDECFLGCWPVVPDPVVFEYANEFLPDVGHGNELRAWQASWVADDYGTE
jgi:hypothetical protein